MTLDELYADLDVSEATCKGTVTLDTPDLYAGAWDRQISTGSWGNGDIDKEIFTSGERRERTTTHGL
ncbi:MAG: hypothetical protein ACLTDF_11325 [Coprococcus sp.]